MATRMQQRRGTAAQWISTHNGDGPILNAGELGFETDTGKFKIGDGVTSAIQTQLDAKAPLASPTFTGTVILPNSTVTNDMLAGSIDNDKLSNSSVTINGSSVSLGGSVTIQAGPDEIMVIMGAL